MGLTFQECQALGLAHLWPEDLPKSGKVVSPGLMVDEKARMILPNLSPRGSLKPDDGMNQTERNFSRIVDHMKACCDIRDWEFEPEKFRMADRTWWKPDFRIVLPDWRIAFVEVKVAKKDGSVLWTDDGAVKAKTVPELHPYPFFLAVYGDRRWTIARIPSRKWGHIHFDITWRI